MSNDAWRRIRSLRARRPLLAADGARRAVFGAALQQSEELFRASAAVGPASKPLPLFYALSQAGRAIAAAHNQASSWDYRGHGLGVEVDPTDLRRTVVDVKPKKGGSDAPSAVAVALDSAPLQGRLQLGQLCGALPELLPARELAGDALCALEVHPEGENPNWLSVLHPARGRIYARAHTEDEVRSLLQRYCATDGFVLLAPVGPPAGQIASVCLEWPGQPRYGATPGTKAVRSLAEIAERVDERFYLVPRLGTARDAPHRLLVWWALLLALSSLARYQPAEWIASLDVDESLLAVDLERTLSVAEDVLPNMIAQALGSPAGIPTPFINRSIEDRLSNNPGSEEQRSHGDQSELGE
ncbi:MAG: YaaC family protein [Solirubrobacteraceae bacterium]